MVFNIKYYIMNFTNHKKNYNWSQNTPWVVSLITLKYFKTISKFYNKHYVLSLLQENTAGAVDILVNGPAYDFKSLYYIKRRKNSRICHVLIIEYGIKIWFHGLNL